MRQPRPGAGIHRGEDEQRLEQDRPVPERLQRLAAERLRHDLRHAHRERRGAAGTVEDGVLAHVGGGLRDGFGVITQPPAADHLGGPLQRVPMTAAGLFMAK